MPKPTLARIEKQLKRSLGAARLEAEARRSGFERRESRVIAPVLFLSSLLHSLGTRRVESLADLHRDFNAAHGTTVNYKPYYERLDTRGFAEWMRSTFEALLTRLCVDVLGPLKDSPFRRFEDIWIHDGTSFALHDELACVFPGRFTTVSPAAVELHATMSLFHDNLIKVTVTPDSECERHHVPDAEELRGKLLLEDRGYDSREHMADIDANGGHFMIRIRNCLDPIVTKIHRQGTRYQKLEGKRLNAVLRSVPKGKELDMDVSWFKKNGDVQYSFRLALKYNGPDNGWIRVMTNLPRAEFSTSDIFTEYRFTGYRLRWQVELYFKELKSYANLHAFSTRKRHIAEGLFWASLCVAFLKRYMAHACQHVTGTAISTRRVAMCCHVFLTPLFESLRLGFAALEQVLRHAFEYLATNAKRSNLKRECTRGRLAGGFATVSGAD